MPFETNHMIWSIDFYSDKAALTASQPSTNVVRTPFHSDTQLIDVPSSPSLLWMGANLRPLRRKPRTVAPAQTAPNQLKSQRSQCRLRLSVSIRRLFILTLLSSAKGQHLILLPVLLHLHLRPVHSRLTRHATLLLWQVICTLLLRWTQIHSSPHLSTTIPMQHLQQQQQQWGMVVGWLPPAMRWWDLRQCKMRSTCQTVRYSDLFLFNARA